MGKRRKLFKKIAVECRLWIAVTVMLLIYCVVPSDAPQERFHFDHTGSSDTLAPYGSMVVVFTEPVLDSPMVDFVFSPVFLSYAMEFSSERDTVIIRFSEPLSGGTDYTIHLRETVYSLHRSVFDPDDDSIVITTAQREREPNDRVETADTLAGRCFGSVAMVNDTDWFILPSTVHTIYCHSYGSRTTVFVKGVDENDSREYAEQDTITIADTVAEPLYIAVHAYLRSVGGYYELGYIAEGD